MSNQGDIAQSSASVATVDTSEFYGRITCCILAPNAKKDEEIAGLIAHIDTHVAAQVAAERERAARLALQWSNARKPEAGGDALRNFAQALRDGENVDERDSDYHWSKAPAPVSAQAAAPVAYLRFRAAQQWSGVGGSDIEYAEWYETCQAHEIGDDKQPAFPVYAAPQPAAAPISYSDLVSIVPRAWISDLCGQDVDDLSYGQGFRIGFNHCRDSMLKALTAHHPQVAAAPVPAIVREAIEATFEQRPGYLTKVAAAVRALPDAQAAAPVVAAKPDRINLKHGAYLKRDVKTTGENCWLLYIDNSIYRALNAQECELVDCAIGAASQPSPAPVAMADEQIEKIVRDVTGDYESEYLESDRNFYRDLTRAILAAQQEAK